MTMPMKRSGAWRTRSATAPSFTAGIYCWKSPSMPSRWAKHDARATGSATSASSTSASACIRAPIIGAPIKGHSQPAPGPIAPSANPYDQELTDALTLAAPPQQVEAAVAADGFAPMASAIRRLAGERAAIDIACAGTDSGTIHYRVGRSGLFAGHMGTITLIPQGGSTLLRWSLRYRCRYPGLGPMAQRIARRRLRQALRKMPLPGCPACEE